MSHIAYRFINQPDYYEAHAETTANLLKDTVDDLHRLVRETKFMDMLHDLKFKNLRSEYSAGEERREREDKKRVQSAARSLEGKLLKALSSVTSFGNEVERINKVVTNLRKKPKVQSQGTQTDRWVRDAIVEYNKDVKMEIDHLEKATKSLGLKPDPEVGGEEHSGDNERNKQELRTLLLKSNDKAHSMMLRAMLKIIPDDDALKDEYVLLTETYEDHIRVLHRKMDEANFDMAVELKDRTPASFDESSDEDFEEQVEKFVRERREARLVYKEIMLGQVNMVGDMMDSENRSQG